MSYILLPAKEPAKRWDREYPTLDAAINDANKLSFDMNCSVTIAEVVGHVIRETKWKPLVESL